MKSHLAPHGPHVAPFVVQLLNTGDTLNKLVDDLAAGLIASGTDSHEAPYDIVAALVGTVGVRLASVAETDFVRATELLQSVVEVVLADLELAAQHVRG